MNLLKEFFAYHGKTLIENEAGFLCYMIKEEAEEFFITDLFISEEMRGEGKALELCMEAERRAKEKGLKFLTCNICPGEHTIAHTNWLLIRYLKFGFSVVNAKEGALVMCKGLGGK